MRSPCRELRFVRDLGNAADHDVGAEDVLVMVALYVIGNASLDIRRVGVARKLDIGRTAEIQHAADLVRAVLLLRPTKRVVFIKNDKKRSMSSGFTSRQS